MAEEIVSLDEIRRRFNSIQWHDSKLLSFQVLPNQDEGTDDVCFEIKLLTNAQPGSYEWEDRRLVMKDCRMIKVDLDLLGKRLCGGDIAGADCEQESDLKDQIERDQLPTFSLPQEPEPLAGFLHFSIQLIPPGGEINIFAKSFELQL